MYLKVELILLIADCLCFVSNDIKEEKPGIVHTSSKTDIELDSNRRENSTLSPLFSLSHSFALFILLVERGFECSV